MHLFPPVAPILPRVLSDKSLLSVFLANLKHISEAALVLPWLRNISASQNIIEAESRSQIRQSFRHF